MVAILTKPQLNHLLDVYEKQGTDAARALAPTYGIKPTYMTELAKRHGVKAKLKYPRRSKRNPRGPDPRWERAKAVGAVIA